jgi:catechol 2,3-dioxygenase-like lactoylglutathione lyase family enzyme
VKSLDVISIPVSDQQKAMAFYALLGFELLADNKMENNLRWLLMGFKGSLTTITLVTWFKLMPPASLQGLVISTDRFDEDVKELRKKRNRDHKT